MPSYVRLLNLRARVKAVSGVEVKIEQHNLSLEEANNNNNRLSEKK